MNKKKISKKFNRLMNGFKKCFSIFFVFYFAGFSLLVHIPGTNAAFSATAEISGHSVSTGYWVVESPDEIEIFGTKDTYLRSGAKNTNEGASPFMRIQSSGNNRALVQFNQDDINSAVNGQTVYSAFLVLEVDGQKNNWGSGRTISIHRMTEDWEEGNGKNAELSGSESYRGDGSGATWNCAVDTNINNSNPDCSLQWNGGSYIGAPTNTQIITNGIGGTVMFDVTADVLAFLSDSQTNYGWLIRKDNEGANGYISFHSKESVSGNGPKLVLYFEPDLLPEALIVQNLLEESQILHEDLNEEIFNNDEENLEDDEEVEGPTSEFEQNSSGGTGLLADELTEDQETEQTPDDENNGEGTEEEVNESEDSEDQENSGTEESEEEIENDGTLNEENNNKETTESSEENNEIGQTDNQESNSQENNNQEPIATSEEGSSGENNEGGQSEPSGDGSDDSGENE
jgi:predicted ribosomally synthesized peptide with SipW-like signal peptide